MPVQNIDLAPITAINYNGTALTQIIYDGSEIWPQMLYSAGGQALYDVAGYYSWVCPAGVTSVCVVCVGGGGGGIYYTVGTYQMQGGGGGALAWSNNIAVSPGTTYFVTVGAGGLAGAYSSGSTAGSYSAFINTGIISAGGGSPGRYHQQIIGGSPAGQGGGYGGAGKTIVLFGNSVKTVAGGGGGGTVTANEGSGGSGGGGKGAGGSNGQAGTAATGGGGGGGGSPANSGFAENGGSGFIAISYPSSVTATFSAGVTSSTTTVGGYKITQVTAAGPSDTVTFG